MPTKTDDPEVAPVGNGNGGTVTPFYTGDPVPPVASPLILNDAYFELSGVNLRCLVKHLEAAFPENKPVTVTSFCGEAGLAQRLVEQAGVVGQLRQVAL